MPNRNWKKHFLGGDFKSGIFRLEAAYCSLVVTSPLWQNLPPSKTLDVASPYIVFAYLLSHLVFLFPVVFWGQKQWQKLFVLFWVYLCVVFTGMRLPAL